MSLFHVMRYFISVLIILLLGFASGCARSPTNAVAAVNGVVISQVDLSEALRAMLWRRGEEWPKLSTKARVERREEALNKIIDDLLIVGFTSKLPVIARSSDAAFQQFLKQFETDAALKERIALQGHTEATLQKQISEESTRLSALEAWLLTQQSKAPDADARAWFDAHRSELTIPESIHASHIFLTRHDRQKPDREPEMRELQRRLFARETTFEELATKDSEDENSNKRRGDLGWFSRNRVPADFADAVFALQPGQVSAPFQTNLGWHIVLVHEKKPARESSFDEVKDEIMARLQSEQREAALKKLVSDLRATADIVINTDLLNRTEPAL
jgi:parvulin-like peptidyl-prolyl isomerase